MTNQIPEEDRKKIEAEMVRQFPFSHAVAKDGQIYIEWNRNGFNKGAEYAYTLGLQSAEKRVKELEDGLRDLIYTASKLWDDNKPLEDTDTMKVTHPIIEEAKQLLSK